MTPLAFGADAVGRLFCFQGKSKMKSSLSVLAVMFTAALFVVPTAVAQTVRFETNAGNFDLLLNPTNNPQLQEHVDNLLAYVNSGRYDGTVINRADEGFVLQMGVFSVASPVLPSTINGFTLIQTFAPIAGVPAAEILLSNTLGQVGLALSGGPNGTNQDSGTSSFYVNLGNNSFLDNDFAVFAVIPDMTTVNNIMALSQVDLTLDQNFGADPGNLYFTDVPLLPNGNLVVISRAFVVPEPGSWGMLLAATFPAINRRPRRRA
jgi:cyclophilin family peptidyl-prolyl cis-trans isomerase